MYHDRNPLWTVLGWVLAAVAVVGVIFLILWGWTSIRVWMAETSGRAQLAEAEFSKKVQLEEAKANLESQKLNSQAEVERAKGAAEAIEIEGGRLSEQYIRYLYVQNLEKLDTKLIYVPTEGGLPILEAGKRD